MLLRGPRRPPGALAFPLPPPGFFGAAARALLRLRPGSRAPLESFPPWAWSAGAGQAAGIGMGGARRAVSPGLRRLVQAEPCSFPASARLARNARGSRALPASRPCTARTRQCSRAWCEPSSSPYPPARAPCGPSRSPSSPRACVRNSSRPLSGSARARSFPPRGLCPRSPPARRGPRRGPETPPSCPEGRGLSSAPAGRPAPPQLPTKDGRAPEPGAGEGPVRPSLFPPAGRLEPERTAETGPARSVETCCFRC